MTQTEVDHNYNMVIKMIKEQFEKDGEVRPVAFSFSSGGVMGIIPLSWDSQKEKNQAAHALRMIAEKMGTQAYVFVSEMWMVMRTVDNNEDAKNFKLDTPPSKSHDRIEALMINLETKVESKVKIFRIMRDKHKPYLQEQFKDFGGMVDGLFSNLLTKDFGVN